MEDSTEGNSEEALKESGVNSFEDLESSLRRMKPPNRKKFDDEIEDLMKLIREQEALVKGGGSGDAKSQSTAKLRALRAEREATIDKRKQVDLSLKGLNSEITKSMGALSQLQSNLHYKSEDKIEEAIRRLEYQLKNQNFRLSEEKKIVNEIDSLKRSKKVLSQFLAQKKEVDEMRANQRKLREDRERYYKQVSNLKSQEDELRKKTSVNKTKVEASKKELDALYEKKRQLTFDFRKYEKEYYGLRDEVRKKQRQESLKKREEEKRAHDQAIEREIAEYESQKEPYEDERLLCNTLLTYLQRFLTTEQDNTEEAASPTGPPTPAISQQDGMYVLKKKPDEELFGGISRKGKKGSKKKKLSMHKPVTHTPQIFAQFSSLNLSAPSNIAEVPLSIEKLQARKKYYENFVRPSCSFPEDQSVSSLSVSVSDYCGDSISDMLSESGPSSAWSVQSNDATSADDLDDGESSACGGSLVSEMQRQTSKTESTGSTSEGQTCDSIVDALSRADISTITVTSPSAVEDENSSPECDIGSKSGGTSCDTTGTKTDLLNETIVESVDALIVKSCQNTQSEEIASQNTADNIPKSDSFETREFNDKSLGEHEMTDFRTTNATTESNEIVHCKNAESETKGSVSQAIVDTAGPDVPSHCDDRDTPRPCCHGDECIKSSSPKPHDLKFPVNDVMNGLNTEAVSTNTDTLAPDIAAVK